VVTTVAAETCKKIYRRSIMSFLPSNGRVLHEKTSVLLERTAFELKEGNIQVGMLLYRLRRRSFGGLLFFLGILSLIPGISMFSGIAMMMLGGQLLLGFRAPRLPRFISGYRLSVEYLKTILNRTAPNIEKLEVYIKPRLVIFTLTPFSLIIGLLTICLAILVIIPLPFTNVLLGQSFYCQINILHKQPADGFGVRRFLAWANIDYPVRAA